MIRTRRRLQSQYHNEICAVLVRIADKAKKTKPQFLEGQLSHGTIDSILGGVPGAEKYREYTPTLPVIEAWLDVCGVSLGDFFHKVDVEARNKSPSKHVG